LCEECVSLFIRRLSSPTRAKTRALECGTTGKRSQVTGWLGCIRFYKTQWRQIR
jgi:hypothetical protein